MHLQIAATGHSCSASPWNLLDVYSRNMSYGHDGYNDIYYLDNLVPVTCRLMAGLTGSCVQADCLSTQ